MHLGSDAARHEHAPKASACVLVPTKAGAAAMIGLSCVSQSF